MNPFEATLLWLRSNIIDRVATCQGNVREFEKMSWNWIVILSGRQGISNRLKCGNLALNYYSAMQSFHVSQSGWTQSLIVYRLQNGPVTL